MRYQWQQLSKLQLGAYAEYFVKMEFTMHGFQVYTSEVDDRGVDFVCRHADGPFFEVQVKSFRGTGYVFMPKHKFALRDDLLLALVRFTDGNPPELFLIPATAWRAPDTLLVDREYEGLKSKPEWGLNLSMRNLPLLSRYAFDAWVQGVVGPQ